jgi:small subunit ribosomal protein S14
MAKMSSINKNNKRIKLSEKFYKKREKLKKIQLNITNFKLLIIPI